MALADFASGAQNALQQMIADRRLQEEMARRAQMEQHREGRADRQLGLQEDRFAFDQELANRPEPQRPITMSPGGSLVDPGSGRIITSIPPLPEKPERPMSLAPGGSLVDPSSGRIIASMPDRPRDTSSEPLTAIMGPDGNPILAPRSQAMGKRPANVREQGRPVMSSDANRIADIDTSLDDVDVLAQQLGQTGAQSKLGAMAPNFVSELTGFGVDAKRRQATIDRVKQVIGKALEDGVLRKEDELKYEKILPTIGDPPEVAAAKITGLKAALQQRRTTLLEALQDANFDTSKFNARSSAAPPSAPAAGGGVVKMRAPDGRPLNVPADKVAEMEALGATRQ